MLLIAHNGRTANKAANSVSIDSVPKSSKAQRTTEGDRHVKRELLHAAMALLSENGREGATSRAICAKVGVGAPALYHHFGDLPGLHRAAIDETFRKVASTYRRSAKQKGPLAGIRESWALFMQFAHAEPAMCRVVIQQILSGEPPKAVAGTLRQVADDLANLKDCGSLTCSPEEASELLWMAALGALSYAATDHPAAKASYPAMQDSMVEMVLNALFLRKPSGADWKERTNGVAPIAKKIAG